MSVQSLELFENEPNADYGGGGTLWVFDYIPERIHAVSGELWLSFIDQPTVAPFKVGNVVPGQKVKIPLSADANIRLYLVSHDVSGKKTVVDLSTAVTKDVNINREYRTPVIVQIGDSTLTSAVIGVTAYTVGVKYRKIEVSTDADFSDPDNITTTIKNYDGIVRLYESTETLTRDYSDTTETLYVRISHSTTGFNYSPVSNVLEITFENVSGNGVPVLMTDADGSTLAPGISIKEGFWIFTFYEPLKNGAMANTLQYRLIKIDDFKVLQTDFHTFDTEMELDNVTGLPAGGGKVWIQGITISYTGISGTTLTGCVNGIENSPPTNFNDGVEVLLIAEQYTFGHVLLDRIKQEDVSYYVEYRWLNTYRDGGSDGSSEWSPGGYAHSTIDTGGDPTLIVPPAPPPPVAPDPPPGYEDPRDPANIKDRNPIFDFSLPVSEV